MTNASFTSWLDDEIEKIHSEFRDKRSLIDNDAFLIGFNEHSIKGNAAHEVSNRYQRISEDEESAVKQFRDDAIRHETERLRLNEVDQKRQIEGSWDSYLRRMGIKKK
jgi:hypothetical protein